MKNKVLTLTYASSITELCEINSSFDSGILRIAYAGKNRNGNVISKQAFENSIQTIYNCPVVCNYDRESDTLGSHDMEIVKGDDGSLRLVNITQPVGVIPQSAKTYWEIITEDDGSEHEYLCVEALIWKRQEAYRKIKNDGITAQSMEITVKDGEVINGLYHIYRFEFTAFALIGVTPCFESAALAFSKQDFKQQLSEMMHELKENFTTVNSSSEDDNIHPQKYSMKGGENVLDKNKLIEKYGIDVNTLDFSIDNLTVDELEEKFKAINNSEHTPEPNAHGTNDFALTGNILDELYNSLSAIKIQREWGECYKYCYVDCDFDLKEVYCWDTEDWLLYGFPYQMDGDNIVIDFQCKKRKKYIIADFDEGEQTSPFAQVFEQFEKKLQDNASYTSSIEEKYQSASDTIASMEKELDVLRKFKSDIEYETEKSEHEADINRVFSQFNDLAGIEAFENLKSECESDYMKYEADALEEKCFAIRGRQGVQVKFSTVPKTPKIKVPKENITDEPYGGVFVEYGF